MQMRLVAPRCSPSAMCAYSKLHALQEGFWRRCQLSHGTRRAQAVARGDAVTVGQAWQQVQAGKVQPDIDSLNTLLKCAPSQQPPLLHLTSLSPAKLSIHTLIPITLLPLGPAVQGILPHERRCGGGGGGGEDHCARRPAALLPHP